MYKLVITGILVLWASVAFSQFNGCPPGFCPAVTSSNGGFNPPIVNPTTVSISTRAMVPFTVGASGALNVTSARVYDFSMADATNPEFEYFNGWVSATIVGAAQEICASTQTKLKLSILTGVDATKANTSGGYNQSGATLTSLSWELLAADTTGGTGRIMKLDEVAQTLTAKTFAQMQADGGALSGNTLTVPTCYHVRSDPATGVNITARVAYAVQMEDDRPVSQTASVASLSGTTLTVTVPTTARYRTGDKLSLAGFTPSEYNTTAGTPVPITVVDGTTITLSLTGSIAISVASPGVITDPTHGLLANDQLVLNCIGTAAPPTGLTCGNTYFVKTVLTADTYTVSNTSGGTAIATTGSQSGQFTRSKTGLGAVTVLGSIQANKVLIARAQSTVASNGFGDIQTTTATTASVSNTSTNWSSVSTAATVDGVSMIYVPRITGTSALGKKTVALFGDSIAAQVNDANQANPSGAFLKGDQYGALGAFKRAMTIQGYPYYSVAVPSTYVGNVNTYGGNNIRQLIARGANAIISEDVHNEVFQVTTLAQLKAAEQQFWATIRAAIPTSTRLVAVTPSPTTAQVSASQWNARTAAAQSTSGGFIYPTGIAYTYRDYLLGTLNPSAGDPDAVLDFTQYLSNTQAGTFVAIDGLITSDAAIPSTGTAFWGTGDGTHPTLNTHSAAAIPMAADMPAAFGFSP